VFGNPKEGGFFERGGGSRLNNMKKEKRKNVPHGPNQKKRGESWKKKRQKRKDGQTRRGLRKVSRGLEWGKKSTEY